MHQNQKHMQSFRKQIISQVQAIPEGKIFTYRDLAFSPSKRGHVAVILAELKKKGIVEKAEKGAFYRPLLSRLGLGKRALAEDEKLDYLSRKYQGYITGYDIYNQMGLTEQVAMTVTLATNRIKRDFVFNKIKVHCVKRYADSYDNPECLALIWILDAIKDMSHIPGTTEQKAYDRIKQYSIRTLTESQKQTIIKLSRTYPPKVRKVLADIMGDLNFPEYESDLHETLNITTRFNTGYKRNIVL